MDRKFSVFLALLGTTLASFAINWDNAWIRGTTPGGKVFFEPNEEMAFSLTLEGVKEALPADTYFVDWERRGDDGMTERGRAPLPFPKDGLVLKTKSAKPGFVCLEANVVTKDGKRVPKNHRWEKRVFFQGGAGVRPDEIPMATEPADYDAFWAGCLKELDAVPLTAEMTPVPCQDAAVKLYAVKIACAGPQPVTGYLTIPVAASATNRLPITAAYRGASQEEQLVPSSGPHDRISMLINPNGYELGRGPAYVKQFFKDVSEPGYGYGMGPKSNEKKETSYWKWCALRAIRYLQWIKTLPEWNGRELVISGGSQGDWQCYHAAAHVPGVTRMDGNGSWGGDWTGQAEFKRLRSTYRPACWFPDMAYFDPVFAAKRISCPVNISFSGLGDYVSTPASLTLIYRNLKGPKKITYVQGSTHGWRPSGMQRCEVEDGFDATGGASENLFKSKDLVYWMDASRAETMTKTADGRVASWRSANGNGYAFNSVRELAPSCTNAIGGKGVVSFGAAFSRLLDEKTCRAVSRRLEEKWTPVDETSVFDPLDTVRAALARGERRISIAKKVYLLKPRDGDAYLSLKGLSDVSIDFGGSELRGLVNTGFFRLESCTNVTIRNVVLDYATLPFTQGTILASEADQVWTVKILGGYPIPPDGGAGNWPFQVYDRQTLELKNPMRCWDGFKIEKTGADTYRVSGGRNRKGEVGDYVVWGMPPPSGTMEGDHVSARDVVYSRATVRCVFENITEYATPGGRAFEEHLTEGNVYRNCAIVPRPPENDFTKRALRRLRSGNHDAFMSRRAVVGPKLLGCTALYHCDDAVNISGMYGVVYEVKGRRVRLLEYIPSVFHVGDTTQAMSETGEVRPVMTVTGVRPGLEMTAAEHDYIKTIGLWRGLDALCKTAVEIEVDDASHLARGDAVVSNRAQGNGFEIRGCHFGRNRAFCVRLRASHGTIADNVFDRPEGCGIFVGPEYEWLEGGLAEDVRIENNTFVDCRDVIAGAAAHRRPLPRSVYRTLVVTNNVYTQADVPAARLDPLAHIRSELAHGARRISLPKARYWLAPAADATAYLRLEGLKDVVLDFNGAELIGNVKTTMFSLQGCTNVTIRNVGIDYSDLPFTQAVIEKVDKDRNWDVRVVPGYPCPEAGTVGRDEEFWPIQVYDKSTLELENPMRFRDGVSIRRTGVDTYRIEGGQNRTGEVGDIAVWSLKEFGRPVSRGAVNVADSAGCVFERVVAYSTPHGCAFAEFSADGNSYCGCEIVRRPPETDLFPRALKRLRSGNHDAFNSRCSYKGPTLDGCTFQYHCDDCVNISGFYAFVTEQKGRSLRIAPYGGRLRIAPGDTCQLMTFEGRCLPDATAVSVAAAGPTTAAERKLFETYNLWPGIAAAARQAFTLELDRDVELPAGSVIISNRRMGNGFAIRNCTMGHNRARGLLIKASDGVMENNILEGVEGHGIQISPEYEWMEGGCSQNLVVRGNTFRNNGGGVLIAGNNGARKPLPVDAHRNLVVVSNRIEGCRSGLTVIGCTGADLRGNEIALPPDSKKQAIELRNVAEVCR